MKNFQSLLELIIHSGPARIIPLLFFASLLNHTILAGSNTTIANGSQKEMKPSHTARSQSQSLNSSCSKTPIQCSSLCQTDHLAEVRAKDLEKYSRKTLTDADRAAQRAVSIEKQVNKKLRKMDSSKNAGSSGAVTPKAKAFWKLVGSIPRIFVSEEARARAKAEDKEAEKYGTNPSPDNSSQEASQLSHEASQLLINLQTAFKTADAAQKLADDARREADQARAYADSMRQSYKSCLSGNGSK
jgi:hypothetical protein